MRPFGMWSMGRNRLSTPLLAIVMLWLLFLPGLGLAQIGLNVLPPIPHDFDPEADLRASKPLRLFTADSLAAFTHEDMLFRVETEFDSSTGFYISTRQMFNGTYGVPKAYTPERYRAYVIELDRKKLLQKKFFDEISRPTTSQTGGALEIQVPFRIKSKTFRRIFGGDRVGLRVTGNITIDGGFRREKSDQDITTRSDQAQTNFKINQTQQFQITGKVGDKVSVEIDQNSERIFDFENNVKLTYTGEEDEIIQSIEAGNVNLSLPGTQLATLSTQNKGLFGFKTVSKIGPLSMTTITSLQKGEKNKRTYQGGSETQTTSIEDRRYLSDRYFFIDEYFRDQYNRYNSDLQPIATGVEIVELEVYKSFTLRGGENEAFYTAFALYDSAHVFGTRPIEQIPVLVDSLSADDARTTNRNSASGTFRLLEPDQDYIYDKNRGYIRLNHSATDDEVIAIAYRLNRQLPTDTLGEMGTTWGSFGNTGLNKILRLIKPEAPRPSDETWDLSWKHVYDMQTTELKPDDFKLKIVRNVAGGRETNEEGVTWLNIFNLDKRDSDGLVQPEGDGEIDKVFVNYQYGEVHFPDLRPFDPSGYIVGGELITSNLISGEDTLVNPDIYDELELPSSPHPSYFKLEAEYSNVSSSINLGINILEDSEEVYLNKRKLTKGVDYTIDYYSGNLNILNDQAFAPGADLEINYESGEIFQLDRRTMIGVRLEYALWEDSFIGGTFLYFNEKPIDERVKVGSEPLRNLIWDLNARIRFRPYFMTSLVNTIPLIDTDEPSEITFEGEIAQVFPNPNSLNNDGTGDKDGVAYIDDFEASKRATPFSIMRTGWFQASHPRYLPNEISLIDTLDHRGRFFWYNPYNRVKIRDIWPNREVNSKVAQDTQVLKMEFDPTLNNFRREGGDYEPESTWNGVMRSLSAGYHIQTNTRFIELWAKWNARGEEASLFIDMGEITEDVIPNDVLDTEDEPIAGGIGNLVLDEGEDRGLDGMRHSNNDDPPWEVNDQPWIASDEDYFNTEDQYDWWDLNFDGVHDLLEPFSSDNYEYEQGNYDEGNGTQNNARDEKGRYPDTEDLNGDNRLNSANRFFRYRFKFNSAEDSAKYIVGGQNNEKGWRQIRIPIEDIFEEIGDPDMTQIKFLRLWMGGFTGKGSLQLAQFELVGNEWLEDPVYDLADKDSTIYLTTTTLNTHDNKEDYNPPPGVSGEIDKITDIRSKEQSLVIKVLELPNASEGQVIKSLYASQNLREYKLLKMFVNGGGRNPTALAGRDLEMFLRFGIGFSGNELGYYEYSQRLEPGWSGNEIIIDLDRLNNLKLNAEEDETGTLYEVLPNGDVIKIVGDPSKVSLGKVDKYAIGLRNFGAPIYEEDEVEIWVDELRLSGIRKEKGMAMRARLSTKFADFLDLSLDMNQRDADFHQVDKRTGSDKTELSAQVNGSIKLDKVLDPKLGVSIPLRGSAKNTLSIPKYTTNNGDIRTEAITSSGQLNIWDQYAKFMLKKDHLEDQYVVDENGKPINYYKVARGDEIINPDTGVPYEVGELIVDNENGAPIQDLNAWGVDTLFRMDQQYTWGTSFGKSKESPNFLLRYTIDKLTAKFDHSESYNSNQNYQYQKSFTNRSNLAYNLPFEAADLRIFSWTENLPVLKGLADSKFNYKPTRISATLDGTETRKSEKNRNAKEKPNYNFDLNQSYSTGLRPFQSLNIDYSLSMHSIYAKEDSTRQKYLFNDQPDTVKASFFEPGTPNTIILESTIDRLDSIATVDATELADELEQMIEDGVPYAEAVNYAFDQVPLILTDLEYSRFKKPWERIGSGDYRYQRMFWSAFNLPFVTDQKTQRLSGSYNPTIAKWLSTGLNYSTTYTWNWSQFSHGGRKVTSSNSMGANFTLKLKQLLPQEKGGKKKKDTSDRFGDKFQNSPDPNGFGVDDRPEGEEGTGEPGEENGEVEKRRIPRLPNLNPLKAMLFIGRKIHDPRFDYSQSLNFTNPTVERGEANPLYQIGLTGDPGLKTLAGYTTVPTSQRTDDFRFRSGIDWHTRVSSGLDYDLRLTRSTGQQTSGSETRTSFYMFKDDKVSLASFDLPNWSLRWSGLEQIGSLSNFAQSISMDHGYKGDYSEDWTENPTTTQEGVKTVIREITKRNYSKNFSPLVGFNITWKYQISTTVKYSWNQRISEQPKSDQKTRDTNNQIDFSASYTHKTGFKIPIPIWPFKNRRLKNETTFSLVYTQQNSLSEKYVGGAEESDGFVETQKNNSWSLTPSINYTFSRTVTGGARFKYGVTESSTFKTSYMEFGINFNISIRG